MQQSVSVIRLICERDNMSTKDIRNTDALAFTESLIDKYSDDVLRLCRVYLNDVSLAEDAFQETFLKAFDKAHTKRNGGNEKYWLLSIARNVCKDMLKSSWLKRTQGLFEDENGESDYPDTSQGVYERAENSERDSKVLSAVMSLDLKYREVILMQYYYDMDNESISKVLNITQSAVRSRSMRAKKQLEELLEEYRLNTGTDYEK